jgi:ABC-type uncharacterized transport system involved in gliding motility auxiliary subunit
VKEGYFGLVIQQADRHETIPFVQRTDDLEYRLAAALRSVSRTTKPKIALATDAQAGSYGTLRSELEKSYAVERRALGDSAALSPDYRAVVAAPLGDSLGTAGKERLDAYLAGGGKLMVLESGMTVSPEAAFATARPITMNRVLERFGVAIRADMVYDLRANQIIGLPTEFGRVLRSYPYFIRARSTKASPVNAELSELSLAWTSSIDTSKAKPGTVTPLFVTTGFAGVSAGTARIDPMQQFPATSLAPRIVAVQVAPRDSRARLIVVGNSMMASDEMVQRSPENLAFVLNGVDWLAQDDALIGIRTKDRKPPPLVFASDALKQGVKYFNVAGLPLIIAAVGMVHLLRRRRLAATPYRPAGGAGR